ncbi:MAG TPA: alkaline phosphatase family protein [Vicinamibacteria bacterium]|nr:alkaline phosphatase family protein [Vicinamibacteria bacterium]
MGRSCAGLAPLVALVALASGCGHSAAQPTPPLPVVPVAAPTPPRVVIFSIDGLRPDALLQAGAPAITGLAARGASTWRAQTVMPSTTLPSHASMLSGYLPSAHGITWDDYRPENGPIAVPTVFAVARAAGLRTVLVAGKEKFRQLDVPGMVQRFDLCAADDQEVASRAAGEAMAGFDLMFVHLPQTDLTGHAQGWMSAAYLDAIAGADRAVGRVLAALPAGTTVIVTADHGGHDFNHGTTQPADMLIPWVVAGPRVAVRTVTTKVVTTDTAATAAWVLGLSLPGGATGRPVLEAFEAPAVTGARAALAVGASR